MKARHREPPLPTCRVRAAHDISGAKERDGYRDDAAHPEAHRTYVLAPLCDTIVCVSCVRECACAREKKGGRPRARYLGPDDRRSSSVACGSRDEDHGREEKQRCRMHDGADQLPFSPRTTTIRCRHYRRGIAVVIAVVTALSQSSRARSNHYNRHRRHRTLVPAISIIVITRVALTTSDIASISHNPHYRAIVIRIRTYLLPNRYGRYK